ncbi:hypothetical protein GW17_00020588 [Ensete ventricosum]|nr:hypothetical protein GW17_00020588 [Ensete ventricosum]RZS02720.1 hypothetical protein BHM03_00032802 [Ensete ventricosum]
MKQDTVLTSCKVPDKERVYSGGFKASVLVRCMWSPLLSHHRSKPTVPVATANISSDNEQTSAADPPITVERRYTVASGVVAPYDVAVTKARLSRSFRAPPASAEHTASTGLVGNKANITWILPQRSTWILIV